MNALSCNCNSQLLRIEFYLDMPSTFIETDGTNPQVTIINQRWHYTEISSHDGSFEQTMSDLVHSGRYKIGYETTNVYQNPVLNQAPDIQIQWKGNAVNTINTIFVDGSTIATTTVNDKFTTWPKVLSNGVSLMTYQLNINEKWWPDEAVDTTGDAYRAYVMYLNQIGLWAIDGVGCKFEAPIGLTAFNNDQFFIPIDLRSTPKEWLDKSEIFNTLSLRNTSTLLLRLMFTAPPPAQTVAYHFISNNILLVADRDGNLMKLY